MKLKDLLNENVLGDLPSSKLMKMKWNPVTEAAHEDDKVEEAAPRMKNDPDVDKLYQYVKIGDFPPEWVVTNIDEDDDYYYASMGY